MELQDGLKSFLESFGHTGVYVVDARTMEVYYENSVIREYTGRSRVGEPCYLIHGNASMCPVCPLRNLIGGGGSKNLTFYTPRLRAAL